MAIDIVMNDTVILIATNISTMFAILRGRERDRGKKRVRERKEKKKKKERKREEMKERKREREKEKEREKGNPREAGKVQLNHIIQRSDRDLPCSGI